MYCCPDHLEEHWPAHSEACYEAIRARVRSGDVHKDDAGGLLVVQRRLRKLTRVHGALDERTLDCMSTLGQFYSRLGRRGEAEPLLRECLAGRRTVFGGRHHATLASMYSLAQLLRSQGKLSEAEPLMREDLAASRETLGPKHPDTLASMDNLAGLFKDQASWARQSRCIGRRWRPAATRWAPSTPTL
jgi:hypothetical protein